MADATIKVRLDTKPAQKDLRKVGTEGQAAAGRVNAKLNREGGGFGAGLGVGAAVGGFSRRLAADARGSIFGSVGDVVGEFTSFGREAFAETIGASDAREASRTKNQAAEMFGGITRDTGDTSMAKAWMDRVLPHRQQIGRGQVSIRKDLSLGAETAETIKESVKEGADSIVEAIKEGWEALKRTFGSGGGR